MPSVVEQFVQRARGLYSLPAVAMQVLELTEQPKVDVRALKQCIENDPALTTRILRVVNSSLFGLSREVTDLNQALALLGIKPLKMLVLGFSLPKNLFAALEADVLARYWRHTLTKAVVARELAQRYWQQSGEDAFIAGLLQEIGELVLIQDLGEPYVRFAQRVQVGGGDLAAMELETLGFDHAVLSARLLQHWGLPESLVQAVGAPHDAQHIASLPPPSQTLPRILHLAELIARLLTSERAQSLEDLTAAAAAHGRFAIDDLPLLLDDLGEKVGQLADVLQLQLGDGGDYRNILADAHAQLADVAADAAAEMIREAAQWRETSELGAALSDYQSGRPQRTIPVDHSRTTATVSHASRRAQATTIETAWSDPGVVGKVGAAIQHCRQQRQPLSLILAVVDGVDQWIMTQGQDGARALLNKVEKLLVAQARTHSLGDGQFAIVLVDYDRQASLATARELAQQVCELGAPLGDATGASLTLSMGLASLDVPPKNFPARDLIAAAARCLAGAQLSGGDSLKSIELV